MNPCFRHVVLHCVTLIGFAFAATAFAVEPPQGIIKLDGRPAPALHVSDYDGEEYELESSRGQWVFVHFWASWCGPCRREMPALVELMETLRDSGPKFVLINTAEDEDTIFKFLGSVAPSLHSYMDRDGQITERWAPRGLPATFFVDPEGRLRYLALGGRPWLKAPYLNFLRSLGQGTD